MNLLATAQRQVRSCTACPLHNYCRSPVPSRGPVPADVLVIGEAPGQNEDAQGKPFVGKAGSLLFKLATEVGHDVTLWHITNLIRCRPANNADPPRSAITACAPHLAREIRLVRPKVLLLVGRHALNRYYPDVKIGQQHGRPFWVEGRWAYPVHHPAAIFRDRNLEDVLRLDLAALRGAMLSGDWLLDTCSACGEDVDRYDVRGVPWCRWHYPVEVGSPF